MTSDRLTQICPHPPLLLPARLRHHLTNAPLSQGLATIDGFEVEELLLDVRRQQSEVEELGDGLG